MSWPEDIALEAARAGLDLVAITDHDTMAGVSRFVRACESRGLTAIPACEIDVYEPQIDYKSELLAYFPNSNAEPWAPQTERLLQHALRNRRARLEFLLIQRKSCIPTKSFRFRIFLKTRQVSSSMRLLPIGFRGVRSTFFSI